MRAVLISLAAAFGVTAIAGLTWLCQSDPGTNFLQSDKRADWIIFPAAVEVKARGVANLDTLFRRDFTVQRPVPRALLTVRAAKQVQLTINDRKVELVPNHNWKDAFTVEVSGFLQDGPNRIQARVFNDNGPPALWLSLTGDQLSLRSDHNWITSLRRLGLARSCSCCFAKIPGPGEFD